MLKGQDDQDVGTGGGARLGMGGTEAERQGGLGLVPAPPETQSTDRGGEEQVLPLGFEWGAVRAGLKSSGNLDLAVARVAGGGTAAACFTRNSVVAAPVTVGREHLGATGGRVSAVLVNAGNANCATGAPGLEACRMTCVAAAETLGCLFDEIFPSSTGIIGVPFPADKVLTALPALAASLGSTAEHAEAFSQAILTTDTKQKIARAVVDVDDREVRLLGLCKGSGMIGPDLGGATPGSRQAAAPHATMLVYLFTDLGAPAESLGGLLEAAVERSFNSISVDGDTSTNDTVLLLASGASGVRAEPRVMEAFQSALELVCRSLAQQIVVDGEGATHLVRLQISGAADEEEAKTVGRTIATSPLCKTAWSSADPNWGRLLAAAGRSGVPIEAEKVRIALGGVEVFSEGVRVEGYDEAVAHRAMEEPEYVIAMDLGRGTAAWEFLTCDLSAEYVRINADYST